MSSLLDSSCKLMKTCNIQRYAINISKVFQLLSRGLCVLFSCFPFVCDSYGTFNYNFIFLDELEL